MVHNKKEELISATMEIVAENGFTDFSMKKITQRVGCSEALIYRHFSTKEQLLYICFDRVQNMIGDEMSTLTLPEEMTFDSISGFVTEAWLRYFRFLTAHGNETMFYFAYRDSRYIETVHEHDKKLGMMYFGNFTKVMFDLNDRYGYMDNIPRDIFWTYLIDASGIFAKRVIRGEIPDNEESHRMIFRLLFTGIAGIMDGA